MQNFSPKCAPLIPALTPWPNYWTHRKLRLWPPGLLDTPGPPCFKAALVAGLSFSSADADHGADLARRWCASCHVVANGQTQASADVPSFVSVARRPDFSSERLAFFLLDPHPKMPNFPLSRIEAADIAAYIASLR